MNTTMTVDIWSDLLCPWCYIGKRRFERALSAFAHREAVLVRWRSFELDPGLGSEPHLTLPERHLRDVGGTPAQAAQRLAAVADLAAAEGLDYRLDRALPVNSFDAHRLAHYGEHAGKGEAVRERLLRAYTSEGAVLSDLETLVRLGVEAGLDADATRRVLTGSDFADAVRADEIEAARLGVHGVPTFVFAGRYAVSGAQPAEVFTELLTQAWEETMPRPGATPGDSACSVERGC
ncbi:DsbA family oxidoreductase [Thermoactinospora rubra]|uniref:DsbA family oxidoreductase n=1 Tax=Thermoactinospora rubra TaxID=1088767 RepID=UPI000A1182EF|nr:DsbA family oxidoreductase [Thermoactinospora rubra]